MKAHRIRNAIFIVLAWLICVGFSFAQRPIVRVGIGWSENRPETRNIRTTLPCYAKGWDSPEWLAWCERYLELGFDGPWLHNPAGCVAGEDMAFDQFAAAAKVKGLEKIADRKAYRRMLLSFSAAGYHPVSYIGSPQTISATRVDPELFVEVEHLLAGNGRIAFDAAWLGQSDTTYGLMSAISWADKGSAPCLCEAIPAITKSEFYCFDLVVTDQNLQANYIDGSDPSLPKITDERFPAGVRVYVLYGWRYQDWDSLHNHLLMLRRVAPACKWVPVVGWAMIERTKAAGNKDWSLK